ncbi:MAG: hypothetical protein ACRDOK_01515 [Streptosporangiaceae bacterium]
MTEHRTVTGPIALTWHDFCPVVSAAIDAAAARHILGCQVTDGDTAAVVAEVSRQLRYLLLRRRLREGLPRRRGSGARTQIQRRARHRAEREQAEIAEITYRHSERTARALERELNAWQSIASSMKAMYGAVRA